MPQVSVLMPTYGQAAFLGRAIGSLLAQDEADWELVVVDDGSPDATAAVMEPFLADGRIAYHRLGRNRGLGAALNRGLELAAAPCVAYLPSDDVFHSGHLASLLGTLEAAPAALLAHAALTSPPGSGVLAPPLQLVQVLHRSGPERWLERPVLESDDLERTGLARIAPAGRRVASGLATCTWTDHPGQRHRAILPREDGGLNVFRARYGVSGPLHLVPSEGEAIDEARRYAPLRRMPAAPRGAGLRILLVGELAYNPERILALAERGHELFGLWIEDPLGFMTVGPLPFGGVTDVPRAGWRAAVRELRPDVAYGLLNWRSVGLAHAVLAELPELPLVWHYKEAPQRSILRGEWPLLAELVTGAAARILSSEEERAWFDAALPGRLDPSSTHVLDGDLPRAQWLAGQRSPRRSEEDGAPHTVLVGRPHGLDPAGVGALADRGIHLHVHGSPPPAWARDARRAAPGHLHLHPGILPADWVAVLSRYDAGWLHPHRSGNGGELLRAEWEDLNVPARIPTLLAAGVPLLQNANPGARVATQALIEATGAGVLYQDLDHLAAVLGDPVGLGRRRAAAWAARAAYTFDAHADRLLDVLVTAAGRRARPVAAPI